MMGSKKPKGESEKEKIKKYKALQERIFDYCFKYNLHVINTDMMNQAFLSNEVNPTLFMAKYLLDLNNTNVGDFSLIEMGKLKRSMEVYKHLYQVALAENEQMQVKLEALQRQLVKANIRKDFDVAPPKKKKLKEMKPESDGSHVAPTMISVPLRSPHADPPKNVMRPKKRSSSGAPTAIDVHPIPPSAENPQEARGELTYSLSSQLVLSDDSESEKEEDEAPKSVVPVVPTTDSEGGHVVTSKEPEDDGRSCEDNTEAPQTVTEGEDGQVEAAPSALFVQQAAEIVKPDALGILCSNLTDSS